ncbi:restriction endonuclease subunit S [Aeromonas veronii]|uniref:restriction endonuclease subunit S n=1 Tax=Aeromonas veronii TaxID=654 RepID=UPI002444E2A4|nr:restriction endonuclease subunit S [Aeromonas veronii]
MVPKGWTHTTFDKHVDCLTGFAFKSDNYSNAEDDIRLLRGDNIEPGNLRWRDAKYWPKGELNNLEKYYLADGDFVIALDRTWVSSGLKVAEVTPSDLPCLLVQRVARIRAKATLEQSLLRQYFSGHKFEQHVKSVQTATAVPHISPNDIKEFTVSLPPILEQKKIAQILSTWDKAISTTEQLLANSQQQKKALMHQLLTGKKRLLDSNGVRFSGEWKKVKVRDLIIQYYEKTDRNNQYPVLTSSRQGMLFQKDYYNGRDVASEDTTGYNVVPFGYFTYRHMSDDLNFSFNINELCEKGIVSTLYPVFKAKEEEITPYLLRLILNEGREFKHFSLAQKQGGSRTYMYLSKLQELKLNIPRLEEQQRIAAVLSTAEQEINALQQKLDALKQEKRALMQQLLTGKLRVQVPKEEVAC